MLEQPRHLESADLDGFRAGDICVYRTPKGTWRPLWILRIERVTGTDERAVHYQIYRAVADANLEGYRVWRVEWDKGEAGVFSLPLAEIA